MALIAQTGSRIANSSRAWQAACNIDITDWDKADSFILSTWALSNSTDPDDNCKLYWRRVGGTFAEVTATSEVCWTNDTVLVNGSTASAGESANCYADLDNCVESEGDNTAYMVNIANGDYGEIQWALGFGSGAQDDQEYEIKHHLYQTWDSEAICQTTITTVSVGTIDTQNKRRSVCSVPWNPIYPIPDTSITMLDMVQQVGYYAGILPESGVAGNPFWYYQMLRARN